MKVNSGSEFIDRSAEEIINAVENIGRIGAEMIARGQVQPEELIEQFKFLIDGLSFATAEADKIAHLNGADRDRALEEIINRYLSRGGDPRRIPRMGRPQQRPDFRRGFTPNRPFSAPAEDPYNHT